MATVNQNLPAMTSMNSDDLRELVARIIKSGELGRSQTYLKILNYLVDCSIEGNSPKEMAIAVDVLGRGADFDVATDSIVRVHIYHLRNKLASYYTKYGHAEKYRIDIPKGQYIITAALNLVAEEKPPLGKPVVVASQKSYTTWLMAAIVFLLVGNLLVIMDRGLGKIADPALTDIAVEHQLWASMLDDQNPILIVIGDYYIFGELDQTGNIARMVREFDINSQADLDLYQNSSGNETREYFNLDLSYIPTSSAFALARIMPLLAGKPDSISIKMMSELTTADLVANHIIYLGYLSGLGSLHDLMFASSDLAIGATYDELYNLETDDYYLSSSGMSIGENNFRDYGMISTFPSLNGNQFIMIAGMRDAGLMYISQTVSKLSDLTELGQGLGLEDSEVLAFEALYEVRGFNRTNFDGNLVYSNILDTTVIWETRLLSNF